MTIWALIIDGHVIDTTTRDPAGRFSPEMVWVVAPDGTEPGQAYISGGIAPPAPPPVKTLAELQADLSALRYFHETAGVMFQASGATAPALIATGRDDQAKLNAAFTMATSGHWIDGVPWKTSDGSFVPMTSADIQALAVKAATFVARCYGYEAVLSAALASNPAAVTTAGWPSNA